MDRIKRAASRRRQPVSRLPKSEGTDNATEITKEHINRPVIQDTDNNIRSGFGSNHRLLYSKPLTEGRDTTSAVRSGPLVKEADTAGIGASDVAPASPAAHQNWHWNPSRPQVVTTISATGDNRAEGQHQKNLLSRSKSWKRGIFARSRPRRIKDDGPPCDLQKPVFAASTNPSRADFTAEGLSGAGFERSREIAFLLEKKPLERPCTEPTASDLRRLDHVSETPGIVPLISEVPGLQQAAQGRTGAALQGEIQQLLLDVEIPAATLERYSVMFASLLEQRRSLVAPRQNTSDDLRALGKDNSCNGHQREARIISRRNLTRDRDLPPIPPLHLEHIQAAPPLQQLGSRLRSNTSPAIMTPSSEFYANAEQYDDEQSKHPLIVRLASAQLQNSCTEDDASLHEGARVQLRSKFHIQSPMQQTFGSNSTASLFDDPDGFANHTGPSSSPPAAQIDPESSTRTENSACSSTTDIAQTQPQPAQHATWSPAFKCSSDAQESLTSSLSSRTEEEPVAEQEKALQDAIQVSIARQISISREQSRMLGSWQMRSSKRSRLAAATTATPRLVKLK
ncbi:uncharacterized protein UV8b_06807 [Ustilaginoidea virens]|uniref:Uncharacterized protein n=1 Tax=Ustilaginoidea virens TaxID=1159556 RepID=A0A8E5MK72_USTVR|nr:uncharacterized protein UV8b_06807 [Ustilaginoidea virens]QUC22566.1 hypothetical protein UV8b_06807 [Ustilaginoidea virens]